MNKNTRLNEFIMSDMDSLKNLEAGEFYEYLYKNINKIQERYTRKIMNIIDGLSREKTIEEFRSKIEILPLVDENDGYYRNTDGFWASEFRQDYMNYQFLPESKERVILCRVTLFILEDMSGDILVSRRSPYKSHPNMLEIPGGHVSVGYGYLKTCIKEMGEELKYIPEVISENDRLFKFRNISSDTKSGTQGKGNIIVVYRVRIPDIHSLNLNKNEISEFVVLNPTELLTSIGEQDDTYGFDLNHAYLYLEYLKIRLPKEIITIELIQKKITHTLMKIDTFSREEKYI